MVNDTVAQGRYEFCFGFLFRSQKTVHLFVQNTAKERVIVSSSTTSTYLNAPMIAARVSVALSSETDGMFGCCLCLSLESVDDDDCLLDEFLRIEVGRFIARMRPTYKRMEKQYD